MLRIPALIVDGENFVVVHVWSEGMLAKRACYQGFETQDGSSLRCTYVSTDALIDGWGEQAHTHWTLTWELARCVGEQSCPLFFTEGSCLCLVMLF